MTRRTARVTVLMLAMVVGAARFAQAQAVTLAPVVEQTGSTAGQAFVGTVEPARRSIVGSAVDGRVVEFYVNEGDHVEKGAKLAQLLTKQLEIQIAAARAELELRKQEHLEAKNGARPEELQEAEARMLTAKSTAEYTMSKLKRTQTLFQQNAVSQEQLHDDTTVAEAGQQNYTAAKAAYELVRLGPRKERIAQAAAREAVAEEEVNRLQDQLEKHTMYAPFDGYVVKEYTEVGQWISSGQPVAEVVELAEVDVVVPVLETYLPRLKIGAPARIEIGAIGGKGLDATVTTIVPQADVRARSFPVKARLKNQLLDDGQPLFKPGQFARMTLAVEKRETIKLVPKDALVLRQGDAVVYVADPNPQNPAQKIVRQVPVRAGVAFDNLVEIEGPLKVGDMVVVEGNERLITGMPVEVVEKR